VAQVVPPLTHLADRIGKNMALILAVVVVMFWNFFVNRYWTYNDVS
jgi:putative flippase GtrA